MTLSRFCLAFCALFIFVDQSFSEKIEATKYVTIGKVKVPELVLGKYNNIEVPLTIQKGFHIQANPASQPNLIATRVSIGFDESYLKKNQPSVLKLTEFLAAIYPPPTKFQLKGSKEKIDTYEGNITVTIPFNLDKTAPKGKIPAIVHVYFQACDLDKCYFPKSIFQPLEIVIP